VEAHLCVCAPCKRYSDALAEQEKKWRETTSIAWPRGFLYGKELDEICKTLENGVSEKGMQRRYSLSIKEISLTAAAILVVAVIGLASGMLQPGRAPSSPQQTRIVYKKVTRTPRPAPTSTPEHPQNLDMHAQATVTQSSVRAWSNGAFIDLGADSDRFPSLSGDQIWSSSGPVALALVLQYWDWKENPLRALEWLKPNPRDENVMVYEMVNFVENNTRFKVVSRVGGNVELLQDLTQEGYPVIVENSKQVDETEGWVGRYQVVLGYDKGQGTIALLLNSTGVDEELVDVESFKEEWRAFNYNFLIVYPESEENQLMRTLGQYGNAEASARLAAELASNEIYSTEGVDRFFAWFNRGSSLADLDDYGGAAKAYDEAFSLYTALPENQRPWRILWYQTRPYWAYYYTGRFSDLIDLTTSTLKAVQDPVLEESYYWRAMARAALGDEKAAITDLRKAVEVNPHFLLGLEQLSRMAE
jgi:tetratricopeptide (TPR) repeat protein